ncbi:MAG TPA: metal-dependent hydrolase [Bacteroidota bacterium]
MKASTHVGFAGLLYLLLLTTAGVGLTALNALAVTVGSVLPDIDTGSSFIGRVLPPLTRFIERRFGHRTVTHSLPFAALLSLLFLVPLMAGIDLFACLLVSYVSHPLLDTCTPNGVRLFYPFSEVRCVFPFDGNSPHRFRVATGSKTDRALGILFFTACLPAFYVAHQGYERFIRVTQHTIESAVRDYEEYSRSSIVFASMDAHDQLSGEPLKGRFQVVGALNPHALVFKGADGRLHTVGRDFESDYSGDNIVCMKGEPARATVRSVEMNSRLLGSLDASNDSSAESFIFGEVVTAGDMLIPGRFRRFSSVTGSGKRVRLNYARGCDLRELNLENVLATGGTVTVKSVRREGPSGPSDAVLLPPSGGTLLTCIVTPGETVVLRRQKGDTVRAGETLALRTVPTFFDEQKSLNDRKRESTTMKDRASLIELDRGIADAALASRSDSLEYENACELIRRGFASSASLARTELKWDRTKRALGKLVAARRLIVGKIALDIARLRLADAGLRAKAGIHELKSEFRAAFDGILLDIRREPFNGKEKILFLIRKLPS